MESDVWMRKSKYYYDYITVYINNLLIASKDSEDIIDIFLKKYKFKLKESRSIRYHLGCDFYYNDNSILCFSPKKFIE